MTILDKAKLALRIAHTALDETLEGDIASARQEMIRAGVPENVANGNTELVETAIKMYVLGLEYGGTMADREKYMEVFRYQLDNIRKSSAPAEVVESV